MDYHACVFCSSNNISFDCAISLRGKLDVNVTRCASCGLLFVNPMPTSDQIVCLYDSGYWDPDPPGRGVLDAYRRYPRHYRFGAVYGRRLARLAPSGRMLEIGCGLPFFLKGVADHCNWEIEGIDTACGISQFAQDKLGLKVTEAVFDGDVFPADSFDLVRAKDVIEHAPRPLEFLTGIHRVLKPGGRVELWLPNGPLDLLIPRRESRQGRRVEMGAGHLLFISPRVMRAMLKESKFTIERHRLSGLRYALKAHGWLKVRPRENIKKNMEIPGPVHSLNKWQPPARERGLKGTQIYAAYREWRSRNPAFPAWLPLGFRQWVVGRK